MNYSIISFDIPELVPTLDTWVGFLENALEGLKIPDIEITLKKGSRHFPMDMDEVAGAAWKQFSYACSTILGNVPAPRETVRIHIFIGGVLNDIELNTDWDIDLDPFRNQIDEAFQVLVEKLGTWLKNAEIRTTLLWSR